MGRGRASDKVARDSVPSVREEPRRILLGIVMGLAITVIVVSIGWWMIRSDTRPPHRLEIDAESAAPAAPPSGAPPSTLPGPPSLPPPPPWTSFLSSDPCPEPCADGKACASAGNRACNSGFTCIFGERGEALGPDERWDLHVSLVLLKKGVSACSKPALATGQVCVRPSSTGATTCVPIEEACSNEGRATTPVPVKTDDLVHGGLAIDIKSSTGATVASRRGPLYAEGLQRAALCMGARIGGFTGWMVDTLTFYLAPSGTPLPPAPKP